MQNSLPLDSARGLRTEVVENAIYALYFARNTVNYLVKNRVGNFLDGGGHSVLGIDGANYRGPTLVSAVVLNANALDVGNYYEILPNLLGKAALVELVAKDRVCLAESVETVASDSAKASYAKTGAGEGLTVNHCVGKSKRFADYSYLVLEEELDRLAKLKLKVLGKSADVVVGLDHNLESYLFEDEGDSSFTETFDDDAFLPSAALMLSRISG